jgi:hypothetical protein
MLAKLLKYDLKNQSRIHCGIYLIVLFVTMTTALFFRLNDKYPASQIFAIVWKLSMALCVLAVVGMFFVTLVSGILRYRGNLLKDEGYLMHTIPVTKSELHISKFLTSTIYYILDIVVTFLVVSIVAGNFKWVSEVSQGLELSLGLDISSGVNAVVIIGFAVIMIISLAAGLEQIFMSLCLGYTSYMNKDIMSFAFYMIAYVIVQMVSVVAMVIATIIDTGSLAALFATEAEESMEILESQFVLHLLVVAVILAVIQGIVCHVLAVKTLERKLNLD